MSTLYSENPVMFKSNPLGFILSLLLVPVGVGLIILIWWYLQTKAAKLTIEEHDILYETGLLSKERREVSIRGVRTVRVQQSFFNRLFGVGKVEIYTAGDDPEIVAAGLPDPDEVRELIKQQQNTSV